VTKLRLKPPSDVRGAERIFVTSTVEKLCSRVVSGLFDLGFLSEVGADSFTRMIVGFCAAFLTFGLLLVRLFTVKYASLSALHTAEPYRRALLADHAFLSSRQQTSGAAT